MMHTYTMRKSKRHRYYVCYHVQQRGWKNSETKSVAPAQRGCIAYDQIKASDRTGNGNQLARVQFRPGIGDKPRYAGPGCLRCRGLLVTSATG